MCMVWGLTSEVFWEGGEEEGGGERGSYLRRGVDDGTERVENVHCPALGPYRVHLPGGEEGVREREMEGVRERERGRE